MKKVRFQDGQLFICPLCDWDWLLMDLFQNTGSGSSFYRQGHVLSELAETFPFHLHQRTIIFNLFLTKINILGIFIKYKKRYLHLLSLSLDALFCLYFMTFTFTAFLFNKRNFLSVAHKKNSPFSSLVFHLIRSLYFVLVVTWILMIINWYRDIISMSHKPSWIHIHHNSFSFDPLENYSQLTILIFAFVSLLSCLCLCLCHCLCPFPCPCHFLCLCPFPCPCHFLCLCPCLCHCRCLFTGDLSKNDWQLTILVVTLGKCLPTFSVTPFIFRDLSSTSNFGIKIVSSINLLASHIRVEKYNS